MCETSLSVWFVCRLCRGSFGQVDAFIEHKKQKHFTQFQNTTSIVFEESENGLLYPVISNEDHELADESIEPPFKIEVKEEDPFIPFISEIIDEPNLDFVKVKSELITYESETGTNNEINYSDLKQPQLNPHVLLKQLTSEEIQNACVLNHHSTSLTCGWKNLFNDSEPPNSFDSHSKIIGQQDAKKPSPTPNIIIFTKYGLQCECKLCAKQLQSEAQLRIHVGICALYHKDRNRFCVICNRKLSDTKKLKDHRLTFHGTEEEKLSLYKFKCQLCPKQYRQARDLRFHVESHKKKKQHVVTSKSKPLNCSYPNCGKEFRLNSELRKHMAIHSDLRPFSCSFPNCNKKFTKRTYLNVHFLSHTGERPFKCPVDNCNKTYIIPSDRSRHLRIAHSN